MAIFNTINKRSGLVVGAVVLALVLFILTDLLFGQNSIFGRADNKVGEIAGEDIKVEEYQQELQRAEQNYMIQTNSSVKESDRPMIQENAWNQLIFNIAYQEQFEELGITVTDEEWLDLAKGDNIHPMVKQLFGNPEDFNKEMVTNFLSNLDKYPPQDQTLWYYVDTKLPEVRIREKYTNLLKKTEYITTAEAKREYIAQTQKADAGYLNIPFTSIPDTTIQISDAELQTYIENNEENYQVEEGRSFDYVVFTVQPSAEDSAEIAKELEFLVKDFSNAEDDSTFAQFNSDEPKPVTFQRLRDMPEEIQASAPGIEIGKVYGPYMQEGNYQLFKITDVKEDTVASARASHILFKPTGETPEAKAEAKKQAEKVFAEIKAGASFEEKAQEHGTDATAPKGGDLGWFVEGDMVPEFNNAVFNTNQRGLLPRLIETQFGYHIIKVTQPKIKQQYRLVEVNKNITFSEDTKEVVYQKASNFASSVTDTAEFYAKIKEDKSLELESAKNIKKNDRSVNNINQAREIVRWAYNDAEPGDISQVITVDDQFVVAVLTDQREEGLAPLADVKEEVKTKVLQEKKAAQIIEKLKGSQGTLQEIATQYGPAATTGKAEGITLASNYMQGYGYDPVAVGRLFGLEPNKKSEPFQGQTGVAILEMINLVPAPEIADYSSYKNQLNQQRSGRVDFQLGEAVKDASEIEDNRVKFF